MMTARQAIAHLELQLRHRRACAEWNAHIQELVARANDAGCGIIVVGQPPYATAELSELVPPHQIYVLPNPKEA